MTKSIDAMVTKAFCTTRQAADLLGVSLRTTQLWVENGLLEAWKTAGGHRRIARESVERLLYKEEPAPQRQQGVVSDATSTDVAILIVEDDPSLGRLYLQVISRWPVRSSVTVATNGVEALVKIGRQQPDFLITDLHMPHMDGFVMLRTLSAMPETASMTIVAVSGLDAVEIERKGGVPKNVKVFPKPIPFGALLQIAQSIEANKRADRAEHAN